ncbi:MAG: four helix bundle protein [Bacteroidota bacterium]|nr:four helix bundle protein [Bacteroidota bacterium]
MKIYSFEKLECWQHARRLAVWIYNSTKKIPAEEKFGLTSQMRRAAISIASNIAEGTSRKSSKDQSHFSTIAYSSTIELLNDLIISNDLLFLSDNFYSEGRSLVERQTFLIAQLRRSQNISKLSKPPKPPKLN